MLGADSTTTYAPHIHFNNSQKLFEVGQDSTVGIVTWGLGGLQVNSHRTLIAMLGDDLKANPPVDMADVANRWAVQFWAAYNDPNSPIFPLIQKCQALSAKSPHSPERQPPDPGVRTEQEEREFQDLRYDLVAGFCIAGHVLPSRAPSAYEIVFDPLSGPPVPVQKPQGYWFWGAPNMIQRLIFACDDGVKRAILASGQWGGTPAELEALVQQHVLGHPIVPIRDAIDFVHACIESTIKAFKFSSLSLICGGPIEVAVITSDRQFRWVRHKAWDTAITEGST